MTDPKDDADFDGVTPDIARAAEKRAAAIAADRGEASPAADEPKAAKAKKAAKQTTRA
jgi:hypothetical protein